MVGTKQSDPISPCFFDLLHPIVAWRIPIQHTYSFGGKYNSLTVLLQAAISPAGLLIPYLCKNVAECCVFSFSSWLSQDLSSDHGQGQCSRFALKSESTIAHFRLCVDFSHGGTLSECQTRQPKLLGYPIWKLQKCRLQRGAHLIIHILRKQLSISWVYFELCMALIL